MRSAQRKRNPNAYKEVAMKKYFWLTTAVFLSVLLATPVAA